MSIALVYSGPGVELPNEIPDGTVACMCAVAKLAGFDVKLLDRAATLTANDLSAAALWLMPGADERRGANGYHGTYKANAIGAFLRDKGYDTLLTAAIQAGLGYVGCCAGAWVAQEPYGLRRLIDAATAGIGEPAQSRIFLADGTQRILVWMGGPRFSYVGPSVTVEGRYNGAQGSPAIVSGTRGNGRVWLCGPHPEAETTWIAGYSSGARDENRMYLAKVMQRIARST